MAFKSLLAPAVHRLSLLSGHSARRARDQRATRIIMLHGVGVPDCTAAAFEAQLAYLTRRFRVVSFASVVERLARGEAPAPHEVALTFDDGLRNNLTVAYPLLKQYRAPALFFLCPGLIDQGCWLWVHEARERLRPLAPERAREIATPFGLPASVADLVGWMKTLATSRRHQVEQAIRAATPRFQPTAAHRAQFDLMNWDEVRSLDPELVTIGGHSVTHPILANCTPEELTTEVAGCRPLLEQRLGRPVNFFCYPNGDFNPAVLATTRATYQAAVTVKPGFVTAGADAHQLPRLSCADNLPLFTWRLHRITA